MLWHWNHPSTQLLHSDGFKCKCLSLAFQLTRLQYKQIGRKRHTLKSIDRFRLCQKNQILSCYSYTLNKKSCSFSLQCCYSGLKSNHSCQSSHQLKGWDHFLARAANRTQVRGVTGYQDASDHHVNYSEVIVFFELGFKPSSRYKLKFMLSDLSPLSHSAKCDNRSFLFPNNGNKIFSILSLLLLLVQL